MRNDKQKVVFLDRDGVINKEVGYLHKSEDFKFIDGVADFQKKLYFSIRSYNSSTS